MIGASAPTGVLLLGALAALNLIAFAAFGSDKRRAAKGRLRIPERRLLLFAFAGGIGGAWAGMRVFRHKTRKRGFRIRLGIVTVLNPAWLLLWIWLSSRA